MKKNFYFFTFLFLLSVPVLLHGQAVSDRFETNCNSESRSLYQEIASNKVIFIVAAATNCSSCMGEAPDIAAFANDHQQNVSVWGAMNNLFGDADCPAVGSWVQEYGWEGIFTFVDLDDYWVDGGFTYFTVINPVDTSIAYSGLNFQVAKDTTEKLSGLVGIDLSLAANVTIYDAYPNPFKNDISIPVGSSTTRLIRARLFDIIGQEIFNLEYEIKPYTREIKIDLVDYTIQSGVHLLRIENGDEVKTIRMVRD